MKKLVFACILVFVFGVIGIFYIKNKSRPVQEEVQPTTRTEAVVPELKPKPEGLIIRRGEIVKKS